MLKRLALVGLVAVFGVGSVAAPASATTGVSEDVRCIYAEVDSDSRPVTEAMPGDVGESASCPNYARL